MKIVWLFLSLTFSFLGFSCYTLLIEEGQEQKLVGSWEEVSWEYEKSNDKNLMDSEVMDYQKTEIYDNLIIHKAEDWHFTPEYKLIMHLDNGNTEKVGWSIKGRGNILELNHEYLGLENYEIQSLTRDSLVIHFHLDLQVKGIVKMTFKRKHSQTYAQKI